MSAAPASGVYRDVEDAEYRSWGAINASTLKEGAKSPAHMLAALEGRLVMSASAKALRLGQLVHTAVLEPELWESGYICGIEVDRRTKGGKAAWAEYTAAHPEQEVVPIADYTLITEMVDAVGSHEEASRMLGVAGDSEVSLVWGIRDNVCKGRVDRWSSAAIVDLKTCQDGSPQAFSSSVARFSYHLQAAYYTDGVTALTEEEYPFFFVAVEKAPPYAVGVYNLSKAAMDEGRRRYHEALELFERCRHEGHWPSYVGGGVAELELPRWAMPSW